MNNLHTLTSLTGRNAGENRTIIVKGFEARRRTVIVVLIGLIPALLVTLVLWTVFDQKALVAFPVVEMAVFWLIERRARDGLQRRNFETLVDKKRSDAGRFYMCGRVIDPDMNELGTMVASSVPVSSPSITNTGPAVAVSPPVTGPATAGPVTTPAPAARVLVGAGFDAGDMFGGPR